MARTMRTRQATLEDGPLVRDLVASVWRDLPDFDKRQDRLNGLPGGAQICFLQEIDGALVAVAAAYDLGEGSWELGVLATAPAWRKHGLGRMLAELVIENVRQRGGMRVVMYVDSRCEVMPQFLRSLSFLAVVPGGADDGLATGASWQQAYWLDLNLKE